jgi:protein-S-isoprenylcysteine O-methyltransferase Ste14
MSTLVVVLRIVPLLAFAGSMLLSVSGHRGGAAPTFAWRARAEENLLSRTFGDRYAAYRERTRMIIPYLF